MAGLRDVFREATFEWDGKTWKVHRPSLKTERFCGGFLERRALEFLNRQRPILGESAYAAALAKVAEEAASYAYAWGGPVWSKTLATDDGFREIMYLLVTQVEGQNNLDRDSFGRMFEEAGKELARAWNEVMAPVPNSASPPQEAGNT